MDFRLYFHSDLLGWGCSFMQPCPLLQCLFSSLHHAKCLCRHAVDEKQTNKKQQNHQAPAPTVNPKTTARNKIKTSFRSWVRSLAQFTVLLQKKLTWESVRTGISSWALLLNVNLRALAGTSDLMF